MKKIISAIIIAFASLTINAQVVPGIEVLEQDGFRVLKGKRVGLVTNPSGVSRDLRSTIDILFDAPEVNLVALYGPEHGVRGDAYAGDHVEGGKYIYLISFIGAWVTDTFAYFCGMIFGRPGNA